MDRGERRREFVDDLEERFASLAVLPEEPDPTAFVLRSDRRAKPMG